MANPYLDGPPGGRAFAFDYGYASRNYLWRTRFELCHNGREPMKDLWEDPAEFGHTLSWEAKRRLKWATEHFLNGYLDARQFHQEAVWFDEAVRVWSRRSAIALVEDIWDGTYTDHQVTKKLRHGARSGYVTERGAWFLRRRKSKWRRRTARQLRLLEQGRGTLREIRSLLREAQSSPPPVFERVRISPTS